MTGVLAAKNFSQFAVICAAASAVDPVPGLLGAADALGFRLLGDRPDHDLVQVDVLELDVRDLDAPGVRLLVDDLLEMLVEALALPEQVVEIAFDGVQASSRYPGGIALRFARVLRHRPDKSAAEADTLDAVLAVGGR